MTVTITSKFNVGDKVFYLTNNKIISTTIKSIHFYYDTPKQKSTVYYKLHTNCFEFSESDHNKEWFSSKEDLINNLKNNNT